MFLNVKRLSIFEKLLLETDLIQIGSGINDLVTKIKDSTNNKDQGSDKKIDITAQINQLLDYLFSLGEEGLNDKLSEPEFMKVFGDPAVQKALDLYFGYLETELKTFREELTAALNEPEINSQKVEKISQKMMTFAARIHVVERIYAKQSEAGQSEFSNEISEKVKKIQEELLNIYSLKVMVPAKKTQESYSKYQAAQTDEEKTEAATEILSNIEAADQMSEDMPAEVISGIETANTEYKNKIEKDLGKETLANILSGVHVNKNVASLIRRIFQFQYTMWTNEDDINREANSLKVSINGFPDVSEDAKEYLRRLVENIQAELLKKAKNKDFDTKQYKGIHYDFNKKLPLYERTALPVTGKQIADDSKLMKFRKASQDLMGLIFGDGGHPDTEARKAFAATGKHLHAIYAKSLNGLGKVIGKAIGGREGEMKADAYTRMFILDTSVVDQPKTKQVSEDGGVSAPGVAIQTPGSIGSMGQITPPTPTSLGSGDNFGPKINKKKTKKSSSILGFADFIKEQNNL